MKTVKKLTAIFLCFVMLLGVSITSASALEIGDRILYGDDEVGDGWYLYFGGNVIEGLNKISFSEEIDHCFEFNAEKDGYYHLSYLNQNNSDVYFADNYSGDSASNRAANAEYIVKDEFSLEYTNRIFYLSKGTHLLIVNYPDYKSSMTIGLDYFAESITDIRFSNNNNPYVFEDYDNIDKEEKTVEFKTNYTIEFSNSNIVEVSDNKVFCSFSNELVPGENSVLMSVLGFEKEIKINLCKTSDFVSRLDVGNAENYLYAKQYYDRIEASDYQGETVTVYFNDGTSQSIESYSFEDSYSHCDDNEVEFPCGRKIPVYVYKNYDDRNGVGTGKYSLFVEIGNTYYYVKECNVERASFKENSDRLNSNLKNNFHWNSFVWCITKFISTGDSFYLRLLASYFSYPFREISEFISYYIGIE